LQLRGYGTQELEKTLHRLQIETSAKIIRMDSDVEEKLRPELLKEPGKKIIIGTEMAFQYLDWSTIDLTVCINLDRMLTTPEFNGEERLWHLIQYLQYSRPDHSTLYVQTQNPEHAFWKTLTDPDLFYRTDLKRRKAFSYPPYSYLVKYMYGAETSAETKKQATEMKNRIAAILTSEGKKASMYDPIELHPHFYRKQYWYGIIVLLEPNTWMEKACEINALLDEKWKVDPSPNSILNS
jgi:primosomal protein N' (replication factor Y)